MIRAGRISDMDAIFHVRTSVVENPLSAAELAAMGITPESVAAQVVEGSLGVWVAEEEGIVAGFSMADARDGSIFALFVLPGHERRGFGTALLEACESWLRDRGYGTASLSTGRGTRAYQFYQRRGWILTGGKSPVWDDDDMFSKVL